MYFYKKLFELYEECENFKKQVHLGMQMSKEKPNHEHKTTTEQADLKSGNKVHRSKFDNA